MHLKVYIFMYILQISICTFIYMSMTRLAQFMNVNNSNIWTCRPNRIVYTDILLCNITCYLVSWILDALFSVLSPHTHDFFIVLVKAHDIAAIQKIASTLQHELHVKLKTLADSVTEGLNLEKKTWNELHDVKCEVTNMTYEIDQAV